MAAVGEEHGDGGIDHEQVQRAVSQVLLRLRTGGAKGVVRLPVRGDVRREQLLQLLHRFAPHQLAQSCLLLIIEVCQLRDADMREVLRAQAEEAPQVEIHRFHREFMGQIEVLVAQFGEVALVECRLLIVCRHGLQLEQSGLPHEDGLYLEEVVAMMGHSLEGYALRPLLEGVVVDAEAVVAGEGHEVGALPASAAGLCPPADGLCLLLQAFCLEGSHPGVYHQSRQVGDHLIAGRIAVRLQQFLVVAPHAVGHVELHLAYKLPVGVHHLGVEHARHVKDHVVVAPVFVVAMQIPVRRLVVYLHVAHPQCLADPHLRIEEVGPRIAVVQSRVDHLDGLSVTRRQLLQRKQLVLPHVVQ